MKKSLGDMLSGELPAEPIGDRLDHIEDRLERLDERLDTILIESQRFHGQARGTASELRTTMHMTMYAVAIALCVFIAVAYGTLR